MQLNFNKTLVLPWSDELSKKEPYEYPFLADYKIKNKKLVYVAALHSTHEGSETFDIIERILRANSIDMVIVEGISNSSGFSPESIIKWASEQGKDGKYPGFETAYTIKVSKSLNIPFIGGEPNEKFIFDELLNKGFVEEDYLFYTFTQQIFQAKEAGIFNSLTIQNEFKDHIKHNISKLSLNKQYSFEDYLQWYQLNNFEAFNTDNLIPETCAPYETGKLMTQRISSEICILRDQFTVTVIEEALNKNDNVMIVYGGSHWSTQHKSLEEALGKPSFHKA